MTDPLLILKTESDDPERWEELTEWASEVNEQPPFDEYNIMCVGPQDDAYVADDIDALADAIADRVADRLEGSE